MKLSRNYRKLTFYFFFISVLLQTLPAWATSPEFNRAVSSYYRGNLNTALRQLKNVDGYEEKGKYFLESVIYLKKNKIAISRKKLAEYTKDSDTKDYILYLEILQDLKENKVIAATKKIERLRQGAVFSFLGKKAHIHLANYYLKKRKLNDVNRIASVLLRNKDDKIFRKPALTLLVEYELALRNLDGALKQYGKLITEYPNADNGSLIWKRIKKSFPNFIRLLDCFPSQLNYYKYIKKLYFSERFNDAIRESLALITLYPDFPYSSEAYLVLAKSYYHVSQYRKSIDALKKSLQIVQDGNIEDEARYYLAKCYEKLDDQKSAYKEYLKIVKGKKQIKHKSDIFHKLTSYHKKYGPYKKYKSLQKVFLKNSKNSEAYYRYNWDSLWQYFYGLNKLSEVSLTDVIQSKVAGPVATKIINLYKSLFPLRTKKAKRINRVYQGILQYPVSYDAFKVIRIHLSPSSENKIQSTKNLDRKYEKLYNMGLANEAIDEAYYLGLLSSQYQKLLFCYRVKMLFKLGNYNKVMNLLEPGLGRERSVVKNIPALFIRYLYPRVYWGSVTKYAKKYGIDPYLILAIIREESRFNKNVKDYKGRIGLMNISPDTAKDIAFRLGLHYKTSSVLYNTDTNIRFGTFYLSWLKKSFKSKFHSVIAGYNAGPRVALKWNGMFGTSNFESYKKNIPYPETRDYLKRVLDNYMIYKSIY